MKPPTLERSALVFALALTGTLAGAGCADEELFSLRSLTHGRPIRQEATAAIGQNNGLSELTVVGDLDGDGSDDALILDGNFREPGDYVQRGAIYVLYGGPTVTGELRLADLPRLINDNPWGQSGGLRSIAPAGDVDGDGLADLIVGDGDSGGCYMYREGLASGPGPWQVPPEAQYGRAYIIYGSRTRFTGATTLGQAGAEFRSAQPCIGAAGTVSGVGDLDADGFADFVVASNDYDGLSGDYIGHGRVLLFYGRPERFTGLHDLGEADAALLAPPRTSGFSGFVAPAGDVDGDGHDDLMVSDFAYGPYLDAPETGPGHLYLVPGSATRLAGDHVATEVAATTITGDVGGWDSGALGDLDGDGADDFAVDARAAEFRADRTAKYVFYGRAGGLPAQLTTDDADARLLVAQPNWGMTPFAAGDVDGDGWRDLIMGDANLNEAAGGVYVVRGEATRFHADVEMGQRGVTYEGSIVRIPCPHTMDWDGQENCTAPEIVGAWIGVGDLTGDGRADVLASAPAGGGERTAPRAYLVAPAPAPKP